MILKASYSAKDFFLFSTRINSEFRCILLPKRRIIENIKPLKLAITMIFLTHMSVIHILVHIAQSWGQYPVGTARFDYLILEKKLCNDITMLVNPVSF